jgi:hypothetical protein
MNSRCEKLLRLALCPASPVGEFEMAAVAFIRQARLDGETFERFFPTVKERKHTIPFGKHAGEPFDQIDDGYLEWALTNMTKLSPALKRSIEAELHNRRKGW